MAETQQIQTHSDSARFKTAESGLCAFKHALTRQGSRPPNQGCADSATASLGITVRCVNWGNFHHGIVEALLIGAALIKALLKEALRLILVVVLVVAAGSGGIR